MRILWYNWRDIKNPDAGGAEVFTHEVCKRLLNKGVDSITLFVAGFESSKTKEVVDGVRIFRAGNKYSVYKKAREFYSKHQDEFDIVVDEINAKPFDTPSFVASKPVVAIVHQLARELWFYETGFPINFLGCYFFEKYWLSRYFDVPTITLTSSTAKDLKDLGFEKILTIPPGLSCPPLQDLPEKEAKPTVLFVGKLKRAKKVHDVLKAFRIIKDEIPEAKLWILGQGIEETTLKSIVHEKFVGQEDDVVFHGKRTEIKKLELISKAHLLLTPGVRVGWGWEIMEASSVATPSIAYDVPGLRDAITDGVNGIVVPSGDYVGMAIESIELLKDHTRRERLSRVCMQQAADYDWNVTTERIYHVMREQLLHIRSVSGTGVAA